MNLYLLIFGLIGIVSIVSLVIITYVNIKISLKNINSKINNINKEIDNADKLFIKYKEWVNKLIEGERNKRYLLMKELEISNIISHEKISEKIDILINEIKKIKSINY